MMSVYNAASSAGNIVGPLLFQSSDAPTYHPGLRGVLGIFVALAACTIIQSANLMFLNKLQERKRVKNGMQAKIIDHSMEDKYHDADEQLDQSVGLAEGNAEVTPGHHVRVGEHAFEDLTVSVAKRHVPRIGCGLTSIAGPEEYRVYLYLLVTSAATYIPV